MTIQTRAILQALLAAPKSDHYGFELVRETGLKSGTLYPILLRLEDEGWLSSRWERIEPETEGRPARRYYRLTPRGANEASAKLEKLELPGRS